MHDYEQISRSYTPNRVAPKPPVFFTKDGTLGAHTEIDGIPFILNSNFQEDLFKVRYIFVFLFLQLKLIDIHIQMPKLCEVPKMQYNFNLERQILCTTKSDNSKLKNPFFNQIS